MSKNYESLLNNAVVLMVLVMLVIGFFDSPSIVWKILGAMFLMSGIAHGILVFKSYPGKRLGLMIVMTISSIVIAVLNFRTANHLLGTFAK